MKNCPNCGQQTLTLDRILVSKPFGSFSLAGVGVKVVAYDMYRLECTTCQWAVNGRVSGGYFVHTDEPTEQAPSHVEDDNEAAEGNQATAE
jgi:predicted RNA-binding Zn-ribbon protein involved in translation (DUF1610 family)